MLFDFLWESICYFVGCWALRIFSFGKFQDKKGSVLVSFLVFL